MTTRLAREKAFWDDAGSSVEHAVAEYEAGPEPNTRLMIDSVAPGPTKRVLDVACGAGVTSCFLARTGADVTAVDVSAAAIETAKRLAAHTQTPVKFIVDDVFSLDFAEPFDAVVGRYALHHFDVNDIAPKLATLVRRGGRAAFLETMGLSPPLRFGRDHVVGRFGVRRLGTDDEKPIDQQDLDSLREAFGSLQLTQDDYRLLTILDRQVFRFRYPSVTRFARAGDQVLSAFKPTARWSYHQVIVLSKD